MAVKERVGLVVSDKMDKTVVVTVENRAPHPKYKKVVAQTKRYKAHDKDNQCKVGDRVRIVETRPLSKTKRWLVTDILAEEGSGVSIKSYSEQRPTRGLPYVGEGKTVSEKITQQWGEMRMETIVSNLDHLKQTSKPAEKFSTNALVNLELHLSFPDKVQLSQVCHLSLFITRRKSNTQDRNNFKLNFLLEDYKPAFNIKGSSTKTLLVPSHSDSEETIIRLIPLQTGEGKIRIRFFHETFYIGKWELKTTVI